MTTFSTQLETIYVYPPRQHKGPGGPNLGGYSYYGWGAGSMGSVIDHIAEANLSHDETMQKYLDYLDSTDSISDLMEGLLKQSTSAIKNTIKTYANMEFRTKHPSGITLQLELEKDSLSNSYTPGDYSLAGSVATPIVFLAHYLWGKGKPVSLPIESICLDVQTVEIPALQKLINDSKNIGVTHINTKFAYATYGDSVTVGATLGSITLKLEGDFKRTDAKNWAFDGKLKAFNDIYDANPHADRDAFADLSTKILEKIGLVGGGMEFEVIIPGESMYTLIKMILRWTIEITQCTRMRTRIKIFH